MKVSFSAGAIIALFLALAGSLGAQTLPEYRVVNVADDDVLNVRSRADHRSQIVGELAPTTFEVSIFECRTTGGVEMPSNWPAIRPDGHSNNVWCAINHPSLSGTGWVNVAFLELDEIASERVVQPDINEILPAARQDAEPEHEERLRNLGLRLSSAATTSDVDVRIERLTADAFINRGALQAVGLSCVQTPTGGRVRGMTVNFHDRYFNGSDARPRGQASRPVEIGAPPIIIAIGTRQIIEVPEYTYGRQNHVFGIEDPIIAATVLNAYRSGSPVSITLEGEGVVTLFSRRSGGWTHGTRTARVRHERTNRSMRRFAEWCGEESDAPANYGGTYDIAGGLFWSGANNGVLATSRSGVSIEGPSQTSVRFSCEGTTRALNFSFGGRVDPGVDDIVEVWHGRALLWRGLPTSYYSSSGRRIEGIEFTNALADLEGGDDLLVINTVTSSRSFGLSRPARSVLVLPCGAKP